ncbi:Uncharacterised protein [Pseudomonas putida]|nr:Uncharacterised protein [Pseudomonas putida]CAB5523949.1 Uncharacterised protein [Pseudomonas putida]CAB5561360.1 Uncharacterised protein [Pseudomonas putida]CAB5561739.1 Uncharacterised protein [Pseudomonas putida]CAB5649069.1 Uncharacterised protein [Pseudomonas putida]
MARTIEIILGYVDKPVGAAAAGASLVDQYNSDKTGFALVNQSAQTGAAVANVTSIVRLTAGFTPFLNIKMNTFAATTVFLKITAQYRRHGNVNPGDVLSIVGNVAGIVGSLILLAGAVKISLPFVAIGVGASVVSIVMSDAAELLHVAFTKTLWENYLRASLKESFPSYWVAPNFKRVSLAHLGIHFAARAEVSREGRSARSIVLVEGKPERYWGLWVGDEDRGYPPPIIYPLSEFPDWRIDIGPIEIVSPAASR